jgi:glutathione S-transferase
MKLLYTPIKGYVHTVEALINYAELHAQIEPVATKPFDVDTPLASVNPLGKVPTLLLDSGEYLAGGPVIYEYLDSLHRRRKLYPSKGPQRWTFVLLIIESWLPPDQQRAAYVDRCWRKIIAILDQMEKDAPGYGKIDIGQMRGVGAVQFLRLKMAQVAAAIPSLDAKFDPLIDRPALAAWYKPMSRKKLFREPLIRLE